MSAAHEDRGPHRIGRSAFWVLLLALVAYANSLGNGFAYDDDGIVRLNPVVTAGDWRAALVRPWWPEAEEGAGLYRPVTSASFAIEWPLFGGAPLGFHAVNVAAHALASLLVLALLFELASPLGALAGAVLFALHPIHTEAVANVVGRAELYAAIFYLSACLLYLRGRRWEGGKRAWRLLGLGALYLLALGSKEIGVTLPGALLLLEVAAWRREGADRGALASGVARESATWALLVVVLLGYLAARYLVLGTVSGEQMAPIFQVVGTHGRLLTAVAVWVQYARLLLFPWDLASDYDPAVMFPSEGLDPEVAAGAIYIALLALAAVRAWKRLPLATLGIVFFAVAILPVSNLLFSTGTLLAERTLYVPSIGLSLAVAALAEWAASLAPARRRVIAGAALAAGAALLVRTVLRNPTWFSTFVVIETLSDEHPESWRSFRGRAQGLERFGNAALAAEQWDQAVRLSPTNYTLLVQAADFHARLGDPEKAEEYLRRAIATSPQTVNAYQHLAGQLLLRDRGRDAHRAALEGLARGGSDRQLWDLVSESYVAKGDLRAAVRAREAAIGIGPPPSAEWSRMAELLDALGDSAQASAARAKATGP